MATLNRCWMCTLRLRFETQFTTRHSSASLTWRERAGRAELTPSRCEAVPRANCGQQFKREDLHGRRSGTHEVSNGPRTRIFHRTFNFILGPMKPTFAGYHQPWRNEESHDAESSEPFHKSNLGSDVLRVLGFGATSSAGKTIFGLDPTTGRAVASVVKDG